MPWWNCKKKKKNWYYHNSRCSFIAKKKKKFASWEKCQCWEKHFSKVLMFPLLNKKKRAQDCTGLQHICANWPQQTTGWVTNGETVTHIFRMKLFLGIWASAWNRECFFFFLHSNRMFSDRWRPCLPFMLTGSGSQWGDRKSEREKRGMSCKQRTRSH